MLENHFFVEHSIPPNEAILNRVCEFMFFTGTECQIFSKFSAFVPKFLKKVPTRDWFFYFGVFATLCGTGGGGKRYPDQWSNPVLLFAQVPQVILSNENGWAILHVETRFFICIKTLVTLFLNLWNIILIITCNRIRYIAIGYNSLRGKMTILHNLQEFKYMNLSILIFMIH